MFVIVCVLVRYVPRLCVVCIVVFFLMIRRPPRSTLDRSSAASDVYKRQALGFKGVMRPISTSCVDHLGANWARVHTWDGAKSVSYTHLRAHETVLDLVCRLLLEKKKTDNKAAIIQQPDRKYENKISHV